MSKVKAFIINYNRLTLPKNMIEYLMECNDIEPIIIDNHSDYPPLLKWYEKCPVKVEKMHLNFGNCVLWTSGILDKYGLHGNYILTDPDLDISSVPKDFLQVLQTGLDKYEWADKCGFSLKVDDLPNTQIANEAKGIEYRYYDNPLDNMYYRAPIDTTFSLFRTRMHSFECIRTAAPYQARHMPWYWNKENIPEDERYYINSINEDFNFYSRKLKEEIN